MNDRTAAQTPPRAFISYSHDSDAHRMRVLALAERLRADGIDADLDQYVKGTPPQKWPRWMLDRLDWADFVLLVCTPTYYRRFRGQEDPDRGRGVDWEGAVITDSIYEARSATIKFVPVLFDPADEASIPEPVRGYTVYCLSSQTRYRQLYDFLRGCSGIEPRPLGPLQPGARGPVEPLTFAGEDRFTELRQRLAGIAAALDKERPRISAEIAAELARLELLPDLDPSEQARIVLLESFAGGAIPLSPAQFIPIWLSQCPAPRSTMVSAGPDYNRLAGLLSRGQVTLVLGADLAHLCGQVAAGPAELAERLASDLRIGEPSGRRDLAEVCERVELDPDGCGRDALAQRVLKLAAQVAVANVVSDGLYAMIAAVESPLIIVSAAYDGLLESALSAQGRRYVVVSPPPRGDRHGGLALSYSAPAPGQPVRCRGEALSGLGLFEAGWTLVFRLRGSRPNGAGRDSLLLSERDYFSFVEGPEPQVPDYLVSLSRDRHLWLLGFGLYSWEDRLLARVLLRRRSELGTSRETLAVHPAPDPFARLFWRQPGFGVQLLEVPLLGFASALARAS